MAATIATTGRTATRPWNIVGTVTIGCTAGNERRNGQAVIALYRHYKNGHRPISTFYSVGSTQGCYAPIHEIRDGACTLHLERSHAESIWRCAVTGLLVGDDRR